MFIFLCSAIKTRKVADEASVALMMLLCLFVSKVIFFAYEVTVFPVTWDTENQISLIKYMLVLFILLFLVCEACGVGCEWVRVGV